MKAHWLNRQNNKNLIIFFAGWSFDYNPFCNHPECGDNDLLMIYDYNNMDIPDELKTLNNYESKILAAWSMGVFTAYLNRVLFEDFNKKIAVNGTITPVDDKFGIPVKIFELTLKHAASGLGGKFYKNVFQTFKEYEEYLKNPVQRSIENRVEELENLYDLIRQQPAGFDGEKFYDCAVVCQNDKIIPSANQSASHNKNNVPVLSLDCGHFPFYNFSKWDEIIELCR